VLTRSDSGYNTGYPAITAVRAYCAPLSADGLSYTIASEALMSGSGGSDGTSAGAYNAGCRYKGNTYAITGARVYKNGNNYAAGVYFYCGTLAGGSSRFLDTSSSLGVISGSYEDAICNTGTVAVGLHLNTGGIDDKFGLNCAPISGATQNITFANPGNKTYGAAAFAVAPTTLSTSSVAVTSATTGVCTVSGLTVSVVSAGTCTLNANAAADTNFLAATQVQQSFTVSQAAQAALTITSTTGSYGTALTLTTSGGSGTGAVTYSVTNGTATGCSVSGASLTATASGTCVVTATKAADTNYTAISSSATTVTLTAAGGPCGSGLTNTAASDVLISGGGYGSRY
jgi:hypothetical protein